MPHIEIRVRDWGISCPHCAGPLQLREFSLGQAAGPEDERRWLVAQRFCSSRCVLLARDLDVLFERGRE